MENPTTVDGIVEVAKGIFGIAMGVTATLESNGLLWYAGVAEIAMGEKEVLIGFHTIAQAQNPTPGVNYLPNPYAPNVINLPTIEIAATQPVQTTQEIIICGAPPPGVTAKNIINLPTIEIKGIPNNPPTRYGPYGRGGGSGGGASGGGGGGGSSGGGSGGGVDPGPIGSGGGGDDGGDGGGADSGVQ